MNFPHCFACQQQMIPRGHNAEAFDLDQLEDWGITVEETAMYPNLCCECLPYYPHGLKCRCEECA